MDGVRDVDVGAMLGKDDVFVSAMVVELLTFRACGRCRTKWACFHCVGDGGRFNVFLGMVSLSC